MEPWVYETARAQQAKEERQRQGIELSLVERARKERESKILFDECVRRGRVRCVFRSILGNLVMLTLFGE